MGQALRELWKQGRGTGPGTDTWHNAPSLSCSLGAGLCFRKKTARAKQLHGKNNNKPDAPQKMTSSP